MKSYYSPYVILATGHSARDIYDICRNRGIELVMKSFAMGVRVEHPQELIDRIQYHGNAGKGNIFRQLHITLPNRSMAEVFIHFVCVRAVLLYHRQHHRRR